MRGPTVSDELREGIFAHLAFEPPSWEFRGRPRREAVCDCPDAGGIADYVPTSRSRLFPEEGVGPSASGSKPTTVGASPRMWFKVRTFSSVVQLRVQDVKTFVTVGRSGSGGAMSPRRARGRSSAILLTLVSVAMGCSQPLPDAESPAARLYVRECGSCHAPYAPGLLTAAMWEVQVMRMDAFRHARGLPPLSGDARSGVLHYLHKHAG